MPQAAAASRRSDMASFPLPPTFTPRRRATITVTGAEYGASVEPREKDMRRRALVAIGVLLATAVVGMSAADALVQYVRVQGVDRYDTAVALANQFLTSPTATVYVASGDTFPDAL